MSRRLEGKTAIITGGTSGIGEATAELFVKEGARVIIAGRSEEKGQGIADRLGEAAIYTYADVTNEKDLQKLVELAVEHFGRLDCLFNNAGGPAQATLEHVTKDDFDLAMNLLLGSCIFAMKYAVPVMKKQGSGSIINTSSIAALRSGQGAILYSAAKAALTHLTRLLGVELGPFGIRVNSISPGAIATPIFWGGSEKANTLSAEENARKMEKLKKSLSKATPVPRSGFPEDIAYAALYLASDEGSFVNCQDLVVDGGRTAIFCEPG
ncbi:MAG: SDR family oxidoreductase [Syntrophales bacterium]|jgi:NAD(P)-dependent dehydrogenase (short-subunit alcohol dehydrogenase family)|nr:SDR family oxidoreductase [Syntrophales bacterium]MDY0043439.1 SDR family oxidoreductase [Syntrophales bacterium]